MIKIWPRTDLRRDFAQWAAPQGVRTVSVTEFAVPDHLIPAIPERLLDGALLDGQPYVAPAPSREDQREAPSSGQVPPLVDNPPTRQGDIVAEGLDAAIGRLVDDGVVTETPVTPAEGSALAAASGGEPAQPEAPTARSAPRGKSRRTKTGEGR